MPAFDQFKKAEEQARARGAKTGRDANPQEPEQEQNQTIPRLRT